MPSEITVTSEQFDIGEEIPMSACHPSVGGKNRSPQISWSGAPAGTRSLAVTCFDPDAPTTVGFCHWLRMDIAPDVTSLEEGSGSEPGDWVDGFTDWGESRYGGMAPPAGDPAHHYQFTVYALSSESTGLDEKATYARFRFATGGAVLAVGSLTGRFGLPG